jgi:hypothetical protein
MLGRPKEGNRDWLARDPIRANADVSHDDPEREYLE